MSATSRHTSQALVVVASVVLVIAACSPLDSGVGDRLDVFTCDSPDGSLRGTYYVRQSGGAAGSQQEFVSLRHASAPQSEIVVFAMGHGYDARLTWVSATHLVIGYPLDANVVGNWRKRFVRDVGGIRLQVELVPLAAREGAFVAEAPRCVTARPAQAPSPRLTPSP